MKPLIARADTKPTRLPRPVNLDLLLCPRCDRPNTAGARSCRCMGAKAHTDLLAHDKRVGDLRKKLRRYHAARKEAAA